MRVIGCDPSTKTGLCLLDLHSGQASTYVIEYGDTVGMVRLQSIADEFEAVLDHQQPDVAVIEGYAYGNKFSLCLMVEVGILLRMALHRRKIPWYIAPPSLVKKFVTGRGNSDKKAMARGVLARWGFESPSDDVVDAYALARIAEAVALKGITSNIKGVVRG